MRALERMSCPYYVVIEEQEFDTYAAVIDRSHLLVLDKQYQRDYDTCDRRGDTVGRGPGPARNFAWEHSIRNGHAWHWVMDDNIRLFARCHQNMKIPVTDGTIFRCMEDFCLRYRNVAMAGPNYFMFTPRKEKFPPFVMNTRIYSCNLIRNDVPFRWRGRYNEDTDLSLRMLKGDWCTVQFNAFVQLKMPTQIIKGGNTAEFYAKEGTGAKSLMLYNLHPDVSRVVWKFGRVHHYVDYRPFRTNRLALRDGVERADGPDNYGMTLQQIEPQRLR